MVRRKHIRKSSSDQDIQRPGIRVVQLDEEDLENASLKTSFGRLYTPEMLAENYRNGFSDCLVVRQDVAERSAMNSVSFPIYLAHVSGKIKNKKEVLVVEGDRDGKLCAALVHHGAGLLVDNVSVPFPQDPRSPYLKGLGDEAIAEAIPSCDMIRKFNSNREISLEYVGELSDEVFSKVSICMFFESVYSKESKIASAINMIFEKAGTPVNFDGYKTHLLYAASFGFFGENEIKACQQAHSLTFGQMALAREILRALDEEEVSEDERSGNIAESMNKIDAVCDIWIYALENTVSWGSVDSIMDDARRMLEEDDEAIDGMLSEWRKSCVDGDKAESVIKQVIALGIACGIDFMIDSYITGTPIEFIVENNISEG